MNRSNRLCHTTWECKYHVVWLPKSRRKVLYGKLRKYRVNIIHELARQRECKIVEGHLCIDHVHMCIEIPPKHSVSSIVGYIKGKSAIAIARDMQGRAKTLLVRVFGHEDISFLQLDEMRRLSVSILKIKKKKIVVWSS